MKPTTGDFHSAVSWLLQQEGGFVNHPSDPGGATKYGITLDTLSRWRKKPVEPDDVKILDVKEAMAIYKEWYWDKVQGDKLPHGLSFVVFDCAVNQGTDRAARFLQEVLHVTVDGVIGPKTIAMISKFPLDFVIKDFQIRRINHYIGLPHYSQFGKGWLRRVLEGTVRALG
jgi:lysozyme family protein